MVLSRLHPPLRAALTSIGRSTALGSQSACLNEAFAQLGLKSAAPSLTFVRHASHAQQGAGNKGGKDGPGKRLGAKKSGEQYVIPGNIIFKQRGTHWFPGENCGMGRDHTIFSLEHGYVKYYKDPLKHPTRQYIGVAFDREDKLPYARTAIRKRKLNMSAEKMEAEPLVEEPLGEMVLEGDVADEPVVVKQQPKKERKGEEGRNLTLRPGYMYREANWEIGRAAERANVKVAAFKPGDRWTAWRKVTARKARAQEKRIGRKVTAKPRRK